MAVAQDKETIKKQLKRYLHGQKEVAFAYLHGSFTLNLPYRDVDIAVYLRPAAGDALDYELTTANELTVRLGVPVDVQVLNNAAVAFRHSVTRGELLVSKDEDLRGSFCEKTWMEYLDFLPFLKDNLRDLYEGLGGKRRDDSR